MAVAESSRLPQLGRKQIHQEAVVPLTVRGSLVLAQHPHRPKSESAVHPDRGSVVRRRIYGEAMMSAFLHQMAGQGIQRVRSDFPCPASENAPLYVYPRVDMWVTDPRSFG
jgi:hypothetical protein